LLADLQARVQSQSQAEPQVRSHRLHRRLRAAEGRQQLMAPFGSTDEQVPTKETMACQLNEGGYLAKQVAKPPPKKLPATDAIFAHVKQVHEAADAAQEVVGLSMAAKAPLTGGPLAPGGNSRLLTQAADHEGEPLRLLTPVGILLPHAAELVL
jgi:hypothetical protein